MKHNLLKSVIISVILLMGVSNAWAGDRIYLKPNSNWTQDNPRFAAYFFKDNSGGETWVSMFKEGDIYVCEIPSGYPNVIFCRMNGANSENKWDNTWNQSSDLKATNNEGKLYTVQSGTWSKEGGAWSEIQWNIQGSFVDDFKTKYSLNCDIKLEAGREYAFKVTNNHNGWYGNDGKMTRQYHEGWIMANSVQSNCTITTDIAGTYKFSYNKKTNALTVTYPEDCYLPGDFNKWAENAASSLKSGSVTLNLAANTTYEFKIHNFGATSESWHGNTGTMKRVNCTNWEMKENANCKITTDFAGNYTFTYNRSTQELSVTYPTIYQVQYSRTPSAAADAPTATVPNGNSVLENTEVTFTAKDAKTGYTWKGWYKNQAGTGTALSSEKSYTCSITAETTIYAVYTENLTNITINVTPAEAATLKVDNSNFNSGGTTTAGISTSRTVVATMKQGYKFVGWTTDGNATGSGSNTTYTLKGNGKGGTGTLTAAFDKLPSTIIYLEPTGFWNSHNAKFVAHVWNTSGAADDITMKVAGEGTDKYYTCEVPYGYTNVVFYRVDPSNTSTIWNQTNDLKIPTDKNTLYEIKSTGDGTTTKATGVWKSADSMTYTLTLNSCAIGTYGFKYNSKTYFSKANENVTVNIPAGAEIQIPAGQPHSDIYEGKVIKVSPTKEQLTTDQIITVNGNITLDDNFVTKDDHVVYLGVPDALTSWTSGTYSNFIWHWNTMGSLGLIASTRNFKIDNITYYEYTIPAGSHTFCFQRKTSVNDNGTPQKESVRFAHHVPTNAINCFVLNNTQDGDNHYQGSWTTIPTADGDYRILYIEQQVAHGTGADDWKTVIDTTYQHSSDIIKKGDGATIVSLHIKYDKTKHPEVILQKFTGGKWVDVEGQAHMVLGPLTASADMAMLPGRRNTEGDANLRYGDGIEEIKADAETGIEGIEGRVWNFVVQQSDASAYINFNTNDFAPYTGVYYIRTDNAEGGWVCYNHPRNVMSYSEYALKHSGYSRYFCKWVDKKDQDDPEDKIYTPNVKFVVANKYGAAISDTIASDKYTDENGTLEADANVRWMWNEYTNDCSRAYIAGSSVSNFLVAEYVSTESQDKTGNFKDMGDWVYEADLKNVQIDDKLTSIAATYNKQSQELLEQKFIDENGGLVMLTSTGGARTTYTVRVIYDFKINKTIVYLIPTANAVTTSIDVIIERTNQDEEGKATQVKAAIKPANDEVGLTVYGLITLTKDHITDPNKSEQEALTYWISFPFDVKIGDITGFGEVGKHWMIKYYDGAERAKKGWFLDTKTFWKFFLDTDSVMRANTGYVLTLNKSLLNESNPVYDNTEILKLYFPSMNKIKDDITSGWTETSVTLKPLECTITSPADRTNKDSHWNLIGVPSYAHKTNNKSVKFFYDYDFHEDKYSAEKNAGPNTFHAMHAYMVQFAGTINWSTFTTTPAQLAAKKNTDAEEQYTLRLELQQNGTKADQTFVELHDDATTMFDMNVDLTKMFNASSANIYTLIGSDNQVAANVMPIANTVIPVGVQIAKAGEYTFAMPDGTDGITVELIDYETNTRTNLLLSEYTVNLTAGTCENRFALSVKPNNTVTSLDNISGETGNEASMKKFIIDGVLYMQKDGVLYDAQGHVVR